MGVRPYGVPAQLLCTFAVNAVLLVAAVALVPAHAQDKNPLAKDPEAAKLGEFEFRANCAFCHGLGARGGGRGPDLTRVQKKHGNSDADLFRTINEGVPGTAMPPNGATQQGVGMTEEEIWQVISYIRSVQVKTSAPPAGNAAHGKELFAGSAARESGLPRLRRGAPRPTCPTEKGPPGAGPGRLGARAARWTTSSTRCA